MKLNQLIEGNLLYVDRGQEIEIVIWSGIDVVGERHYLFSDNMRSDVFYEKMRKDLKDLKSYTVGNISTYTNGSLQRLSVLVHND